MDIRKEKEEFDKSLKRELYFNRKKKELEKENEAIEKLSGLLLLYITREESNQKIKEKINKYKIGKSSYQKIEREIKKESKIIDKESKVPSLGKESILGFSFYEIIKNREKTIKNKLRIFVNDIKDIIKEKRNPKDMLRRFIEKEKINNNMMFDMLVKRGREYAYAYEDKRKEERIKGWMSVAVLDNRTSRVCAILHGKFYSKKDYKSRFDLPRLPPRHPNCRSYITTIEKGINEKELLKENLNSFLERNSDIGKELLGIKKYDLFIKSKKKIVSFIDFKNVDFLTNEEIEKKLK